VSGKSLRVVGFSVLAGIAPLPALVAAAAGPPAGKLRNSRGF
jgi:hypothetical protein